MFLFEESVVDIIASKDRIIYKDSDNHGSFFFVSQKLLTLSLFIMGTCSKFVPRSLGERSMRRTHSNDSMF
jgi:hypothetical protein